MCLSRDQVTPKWRGEAKSHRSRCGVKASVEHTTVKSWIFSRLQLDVQCTEDNRHVNYVCMSMRASIKLSELHFAEPWSYFLETLNELCMNFIHMPVRLKAELTRTRTSIHTFTSGRNGTLWFKMNDGIKMPSPEQNPPLKLVMMWLSYKMETDHTRIFSTNLMFVLMKICTVNISFQDSSHKTVQYKVRHNFQSIISSCKKSLVVVIKGKVCKI